MIRIIIVEDEQSCSESLKRILNQNAPDAMVVAETDSVTKAIELIQGLRPDLIFLDIHLTDGLGFEVLTNTNYREFKVVFLTAHDNYAITAFRYNAIDYLLKPVDAVQVLEALERVRHQPMVSSAFEERFRTLLTNNQSDRKKIALPSFEGITMLNINEIVHCSSDGSYTTFYTIKGKKIVVSKPIREYDELLSPHNFFRVHQSHLVNLSYVEQFLKEDGGTLIMTDSSRIEVSRRRKDLLMEILLKNGL
jgi:two-component system LytT family response regulator